MEQNRKDLFSIGKVASAIGITRRIILNYEDKGLVEPDIKEGKTGNRYYSIDTFTHIRTIRILQNLGLSLDEIRAYFDSETDFETLIKRLEAMRDELDRSIEKLRERSAGSSNAVKVITVPAGTVYRHILNSPTVEKRTSDLRNTAIEAMKNYGTDTTRRMYSIEFSIDSPDNITYMVSVPESSKGENVVCIPEFRALSTFHHGAYEELPSVRARLLRSADENRLRHKGICRHTYLEGPPQHKDKSKFITQVMLVLEDMSE